MTLTDFASSAKLMRVLQRCHEVQKGGTNLHDPKCATSHGWKQASPERMILLCTGHSAKL